jgi:hypothetical protein
MREVCWLCLNTGRILDLVQVAKRKYEPGPDHGKFCMCERGHDARIAEIAERRLGQRRIPVSLDDL